MDILAHVSDDQALARMYRVEWGIVPNIGIDLVMPLFVRVMPLFAAGKIFLGLAILLPFAGTVTLHYAVFRRRSYWPLAAAFIVYNRLFFLGFINFEIGIGLALIAAAVWQLMKGRPKLRVAVATIWAIAIFFCHLLALAYYALLLISLELPAIWKLRSLNIKVISAPLVPFVIPTLLYLRAPISEGDSEAAGGFVDGIRHYYWALIAEHGLKPLGLFGAFLTYDRLLDAAAAIMIVAITVACAAMQSLRAIPFLLAAAILLLAVYPFVPFVLMKTAWIDQRLPVMASFLLIAAVAPRVRRKRLGAALAIVCATIFLWREIKIVLIWTDHDRAVTEFRKNISFVSANERVLVVRPNLNPDRTAPSNNPDSVTEMLENDASMHLPALLVIDRRAFWPLLFTAIAKQPVAVVPPYNAISMPEGITPQVKDLTHPSPAALEAAPYLKDWPYTFDWVLLLRPAAVPDADTLLPERLMLVDRGRLGALYKVRK